MRTRTATMWAVINAKTGKIVSDVSRRKSEARFTAYYITGWTSPSERELIALGFKTVQVKVCDLHSMIVSKEK